MQTGSFANRASRPARVAGALLLMLLLLTSTLDRAAAEPGPPSPAHSEFTADLSLIELGSEVDATITVRDAAGSPLSGVDVSIWVLIDFGDGVLFPVMVASNHPDAGSGNPEFGVFSIDDNGDGTYTPRIIAGSVGTQTVYAYIGFVRDESMLIGSQTGTVVPPGGQPFGANSSIEIDPPDPEFGETVTLTLTLRNADNQPVDGVLPHEEIAVFLFPEEGGTPGGTPIPLPPWEALGDGVYTLSVPIGLVGRFQVVFLIPYPGTLGDIIGALQLDVPSPPPGPLAGFEISHYASSTVRGAPFPMRITAVDGDGIPLAFGSNELSGEYDVLIDIDGEDAGEGLGPVTLVFLEGVAQHELRFLEFGGGQVVTVRDAGDPGVTGSTGPISAVLGGAVGATSSIEGPEDEPQVGMPMHFIVTVRDEGGNPIEGAVGSISIYLNDEGESQHAPEEIGGGEYRWTYTPTAPGTFFIAVYIGANHGDHEGQGDPIGTAHAASHPGPLHHFAIVEAPGGGPVPDQQAGVPFSVRVFARDAGGFPLSSGPHELNGAYAATVTATGEDGEVTGTGTGDLELTFTGGFATLTLTLAERQQDVLLAIASREDGHEAVGSVSGSFDVHPGPLASFTIEVDRGTGWDALDGLSVEAGSLLLLRLTARDAFGHLLDAGPNTFGSSVTLSSNAAGTAAVGLGASPAFTSGILLLDGSPHAMVRLTAARAGATLVAQAGGVTSTSGAFEVETAAPDAVASSVHAPTGVAPGGEALVTVTVRDGYGNIRSQGGDAVALTLSDEDDPVTLVDAGDGTYRYALTRETPVTVTARAYLGTDDTGDLIGEATVAFVEPPEEPAAPDEPPAPSVTTVPEPGNVGVPVPDPVRVPLVAGSATEATASRRGSSVRVTAPAGAVIPSASPGTGTADGSAGPSGLRLEIGLVEDVDEVSRQAPPPPSAPNVVGKFTARLVDEAGQTHHQAFAEPVLIEFTFPATDLPASVGLDDLVLVYWNGDGWVEVPATASIGADGFITMSARVMHFTLFSALATGADWGTFAPAGADPGGHAHPVARRQHPAPRPRPRRGPPLGVSRRADGELSPRRPRVRERRLPPPVPRRPARRDAGPHPPLARRSQARGNRTSTSRPPRSP